ncbi:hypothetical protein ACLG6S_16835 [Thermodesulfobacteriota bacterium B35]
MARIITATFASDATLKNTFDDLVNTGLPTEKIFVNHLELQVKIISGPEIEGEIMEVVNRHNPTGTASRELEEKETARVITATYGSAETLKNVTDDLINIGLPAEEIYADKAKKQVKVIAGSVIEPEIREVLGRHNPVEVS